MSFVVVKQRTEHDSLGQVQVPEEALWGAHTQRALENFQISGYRFPREFLISLAQIKGCAAEVNAALGRLSRQQCEAIVAAAADVEGGAHDAQFPLDVFQTGSGTSTNMNMNEVIATLAGRIDGNPIHPLDHVNLSQSSNDVIPSAIHVSVACGLHQNLLPALGELAESIRNRAIEFDDVVKTGRTHLMDAVPIRMGQEFSAWETQVRHSVSRLRHAQSELLPLAIGGTAVGTGLNAPEAFGARVAKLLAERTDLPFTTAPDRCAAIAAPDALVQASAQLRGTAIVLTKISNDLRWMNSGPVAGLGEIQLMALQPGSSMMPGKVNPVIPEAVAMSCLHAIGNDAAVAQAAQAGNFQLNTMLPLIGWSLLSNVRILANAARTLAVKAIDGFTVRRQRLQDIAGRNPILATALTPEIGYEASAAIAREAEDTGRSVLDVAIERTSLRESRLRELLDPRRMAGGAI